MGFYIEVPENHNKAAQLCDLHGAQTAFPAEAAFEQEQADVRQVARQAKAATAPVS